MAKIGQDAWAIAKKVRKTIVRAQWSFCLQKTAAKNT